MSSTVILTVDSVNIHKICLNSCSARRDQLGPAFCLCICFTDRHKQAHTEADTQAHRHTDNPGVSEPKRSQYIQSMKMTECKNCMHVFSYLSLNQNIANTLYEVTTANEYLTMQHFACLIRFQCFIRLIRLIRYIRKEEWSQILTTDSDRCVASSHVKRTTLT